MSLSLGNVRWRSGSFEVTAHATWTGRVTGLFGPSGAGKTTLLELVAGLRRPQSGSIASGETVFDDRARGIFVPPERRRLGYVPQDAALFPHLTVEANIRFGCRGAGTAEVDRLCVLLGIDPLRGRDVTGLSGGERQRVAIARALAMQPRLLLLDEPLAALDVARKETILPYLRRLRDETQVPMLYVSHALPELVALCDDLAVIEGGRILQHGPIEDVLRRPQGADVARLVGVETIQSARVHALAGGLAELDAGGARLRALAPELASDVREVLVTIRAEDVILVREVDDVHTSARNRLLARVTAIEPAGATVRVELDAGFPLVALLTRPAVEDLQLAPGGRVQALIKAPHVHVIPVR